MKSAGEIVTEMNEKVSDSFVEFAHTSQFYLEKVDPDRRNIHFIFAIGTKLWGVGCPQRYL